MTHDPDDIVKVATGTLVEVEAWREALVEADIDARLVGDHLTAGMGTAIPGSVELWVHRGSAAAAEAVLRGEAKHAKGAAFGHPTSEGKPDHSRGPTHGAPPHRPI